MKKNGFIGHHVAAEETTVVHCLNAHFKLEPPRIEELFELGAVYLDKRRIQKDTALKRGGYLRIHLQPKRFPVEGVDWRSVVVHETTDFMTIRKPAGVPVHASLDNLKDNVLHQLRAVTRRPLLVTQRLDVPVAGLMVLAKTPDFQRRFNQWLVEHKIHKTYRALVLKEPTIGRHVHFMEPSERSPKRVGLEEKPGWLRCELAILASKPLMWADTPVFEAEIELLTGRTHQIRAQFAALGLSILGDGQYGSRREFNVGGLRDGIALFSAKVAWAHAGKEWQFEARPPWDEKETP